MRAISKPRKFERMPVDRDAKTTYRRTRRRGANGSSSGGGASVVVTFRRIAAVLRDRTLRLLAVGEPDVEDRMLHGVEARALGEHPAGEDALLLPIELYLVHLDEGGRLRLLLGRTRVADARRHLEGPELHGGVEGDLELGGAGGDLVQRREDGNGVLDAVGARGSGPQVYADRSNGDRHHDRRVGTRQRTNENVGHPLNAALQPGWPLFLSLSRELGRSWEARYDSCAEPHASGRQGL